MSCSMHVHPMLASAVEEAKAVIREALDKYALSELAFSFNGGKDSTVLLYLLHDVFTQMNLPLSNLLAFYIVEENSFAEVNDFTNAVAEKYGLRMVFLQNTDFKAALRQCVNDYHTKAVFIGTRNTDPYCGHLSFFCRTDVDKGWPDLIRINPILRWSYADVWDYLRQDVSRTYCSLYDAGYTSIGRIDNTTRNQALLCEDGSFRPAYALQDGSQERDGRFSAKR